MNIILLSKSITTNDLSEMRSSSAKFEYSFALNLSIYTKFNITILSAALAENIILNTKENNFKIIGINGGNTQENLINFKRNIKLLNSKNIAVIYYGYDLRDQFNLLRIKKKFGFKTIPFIFDSHQGATENFKRVKRQISNIYFNTSIQLLNSNDAVLLFNKQAVKELNIKKPYLITRPGLQVNTLINKNYYRKNNKLVLLYAGTLIKYNGILELLSSFSKIDSNIFQLKIFGDGPLKNEVIKFSENDERIFYGGLVQSGDLQDEYKHADLLVNLRNPNHIVSRYSFPSKLIEYISYGKPILTTNLDFDEELSEGLYLINDLSNESIKNKILEIELESNESINNKIDVAQKYISEKNNWRRIIKEIEVFLNDNIFS